jgi:lipoprotein-anchoring transpeptidase ErfK/SrfK
MRTALRRVGFGAVVFFTFIFLSANVYASKNISKEYLAYNIIKLAKGTKVLLVVKSSSALYIINDGLGTQAVFHAISGKAKGDKQKRGDLKTPEGTYFFVEAIDGEKLPGRYGVLAVVMDYPNPIDKLVKKTGSGIWLHGTDDPPRLKRPRDSKGCVVAHNGDVLRIVNYIEIGRTPVIVVEDLTRGSFAETFLIKKSILKFLLEKEFIKAKEESKVSIFRHSGGFVATVAKGKTTTRYYIKKDSVGWSLIGKKTQIGGGEFQGLLDAVKKPRYLNRR